MINSKLLHLVVLILAVCAMPAVEVAAQGLPREPDKPPRSKPSSRPISREEMSTAAMTPEAPGAVQQPKTTDRVCGNPKIPCRTEYTFQPFDLPFRVLNPAVIYETELFYAVILKSKPAPDDNCDIFFSETERLSVQELFPDQKVFASRCADPENLFYTNTKRDHRILGVYAGKTLAEANRTLAAVKATGKFAGANIRRMRTGFNGT